MRAPAARFVGQRVARREDPRFLTGRGEYVADLDIPGVAHVAFVRSPVARGRIVSIDTSEALALPGVRAVYTAEDLAPLVHDHRVNDENPMRDRPFRLMASGDVRCVGEAIAMVVADSRYIAEDALELIDVDIEAERPVLDVAEALATDAPLVHPGTESNMYIEVPAAPNPELAAILANAPVVLTETFHQHRYSTVPLETRGVVSLWDPRREDLTVWISTQGPHGDRAQFARLLGIDDSQVRVIMPDTGGSFGLKMFPSPDELAVIVASKHGGRPLKWIQDRRENLMADEQARGDSANVTFAATEDGVLLGAKVEFLEHAGSFPAGGGSAAVFTTVLFPAPYKFQAVSTSAKSVMTNTFGRGAYRGPWMIETVARETMLDALAAHLEIDPLEIRRRNVVTADDLPYALPSGMVLDQVTCAETLDQAAEILGYEGLRAQQAQWRAEGRLVGIGMALFAEPSAITHGYMTTDAASIRVNVNGRVDVAHTGASHGQSLETTVAQVVADELGVDIDSVRVIQGDTDATPVGPGTGGSRSAVILGGAARAAAAKVREQMFEIVAHQFDVSLDDLQLCENRICVLPDLAQGMTFKEIAAQAYTAPAALPPGQSPGLEAIVRYAPDSFVTWSNACHMCLIEIDPDTGGVEILRYVVSEDCGVMVNPNVVEGQIAGGVVQGLGGVLLEHQPYDDEGNPLSATFVDYLLPTTTDVPEIEYGHIESFAPTNAGGHKGMGEGGAIGSPPAVFNAVADALAPLGVKVRSQPLGPADIVALIEEATGGDA